MESGKVKASQLLSRRNTVEEFYSPAVERIKLLTSSCPYPLEAVAKFAHVRGGKRLPPNTPYFDNGDGSGVPYVRTCDIRPEAGSIDLSDVVFIDESTHKAIHNYQLQENDIVISIAGTIGAVGVLRESLDRCNFNENMAKVRVFDSEFLPEYVAAYFDSSFGQAYIQWLTGGAVQAKLSLERIKEILVPKLSSDKQREIIAVMSDAFKQRGHLLEEIDQLQNSFDSFLRSRLGIEDYKIEDESRFSVKVSALKQRHDADFFLPKHFSLQQLLRSAGAKLIKDVFDFSRETHDPSATPLENFNYVDIASINVHLGIISSTETITGETAPSRARKLIREGEIIVSTVRPTRGAIAIIPEEYDSQICSTGFTVLKPRNGAKPRYLHAVLRSSVVRQQFGRFATGASYPAITDSLMKEVLIPVSEDKRIQDEIAGESEQRLQDALKKLNEAGQILQGAKSKVDAIILGSC